jgi:hypothetical protein
MLSFKRFIIVNYTKALFHDQWVMFRLQIFKKANHVLFILQVNRMLTSNKIHVFYMFSFYKIFKRDRIRLMKGVFPLIPFTDHLF